MAASDILNALLKDGVLGEVDARRSTGRQMRSNENRILDAVSGEILGSASSVKERLQMSAVNRTE